MCMQVDRAFMDGLGALEGRWDELVRAAVAERKQSPDYPRWAKICQPILLTFIIMKSICT